MSSPIPLNTLLHYHKKARVIWLSLNLLWCSGKWLLHPGRVPQGAVPRRLEGGVRALLCWLHQERPLRRLLRRRQGCAGHRHGMGPANFHIMMDWWMDNERTYRWPSLTADGPANVTYLAIELVHVQQSSTQFGQELSRHKFRHTGPSWSREVPGNHRPRNRGRSSGARNKLKSVRDDASFNDGEEAGLCASSSRAQILLYPWALIYVQSVM